MFNDLCFMTSMIHKTVLLHEAIEGLALEDGDVVIDATLGSGGHTEAMLATGKDIFVIGIDLDTAAIERSRERLQNDSRVTFVCDSYRNMASIVSGLGIEKVTKVLFDFGFSSDQIQTSGRGFSFERDEPLLMTFKEKLGPDDLTAFEIVNSWDEEAIRGILRNYGEERFAGRIAKGIIKARQMKSIGTTAELVEVIKSSTPFSYHRQRLNPATRTFQSLRIAVNDELGAIADGIDAGFRLIPSKGRMATICFHSQEDRIVKQTFKAWAQTGFGALINKRPMVPSDEEVAENPRSRSAKLRIIEKI
jgi:16S rRNA (cytosine1402-N4)-methyltransferase